MVRDACSHNKVQCRQVKVDIQLYAWVGIIKQNQILLWLTFKQRWLLTLCISFVVNVVEDQLAGCVLGSHLRILQQVTSCTQLIYRYLRLYSMIICNRYIATLLQTITLRLREILMSDSSDRPTISIAGDVSIVTSPVLLLVLLCCVLCTQQWWVLR